MNHHHRKILYAFFAHPVAANLNFKDAQSTLNEIGASIEERSGARIAVSLQGHSILFHHINHSLPKETAK